ncbi:MAG: tetraacyldisaccharide 4'-kinase [Alphaproteobacteria bacterium]|nr:tetraacyldisaccharide 4'-kinase [Alphaproteobacteria bacterium]
MRAPDFWRADGGAARLLDPLGRAYGLAGTLRRRLVTPTHARVPVICIGNLTVGGSGKTPTAIAIAKHLQAMHARPHFLTRGYGGRERGPLRVDPAAGHDAAAVGDEALLLARAATAWVSADRVAGADAAAAAGASHIVMDDGLQNPYLAKDLTFLVIDGAVGFGNRRLLPAGPLREPIADALARIDAAIVIGEDRAGIEALLPAGLTRLQADLAPDGDLGHLEGQRVLAFAGIGRPEKFFETLEGLGADIVETYPFPDHHRYRPKEIERLIMRARQFDAVPITTEKDHVRLAPNFGKSVEKLPVRLKFHKPLRLNELLSTTLAGHAAAAK